ncbi:MAG: prepilin-type N-terminal cleavage/methylation domain-containing protein [Deltaproteobacteria bacterium]|nr:prepilin-type N-terminal cleavage/methylation domain-containing protein [Deltaproteobacteria bacterium]
MLRRRRGEEGFTLIEVMMSLAILVVGAVGILSMQSASTRGNVAGRRMSVGTQRSSVWIERIRRDALFWQTPGDPVGVAPSAQYITRVGGDWFVPVSIDTAETAAASWTGQDIAGTMAPQYCTHIRLSWAIPNQSIRADVRTFWSREHGTQHTLVTNNCSLGTEAAVSIDLASAAPDLSAVYSSTLLRWNPEAP